MARIEDLLAEIPSDWLRRELEDEIARLKSRVNFGLVFERHVPEYTRMPNFPIVPGGLVIRPGTKGSPLYEVQAVKGKSATIVPRGEQVAQDAKVGELVVVKRFGEPVYPALKSVDAVARGGDKPWHAVLKAENYHALQLLAYTCERQVDVIYIDPPYNTGAKDWRYNNDYVDTTDTWRHSKWLSFMEKRLQIAKKLLRPDGVLVVTIDEHEVIHLGMLLEQLFPEYDRYLVTIVNNPKGTGKKNFGRTDEYAFFCCPQDQGEVIAGELVDPAGEEFENWHLRRRGSESSHRHQRWRSFYALLVDIEKREVVGVGPEVGKDEAYEVTVKKGIKTYYPITKEGEERTWRYSRETMQKYIAAGEIVITERNKGSGGGSSDPQDQTDLIFHRRVRKKDRKRLKTVWWGSQYDAGTHGTELLVSLLGERNLFPFPKSVYAARDCIAAVVQDRPNALVLDFFAGSGTTLHATCMLNAQDGGSRRCILVTNNEVEDKLHRKLVRAGKLPGDPAYEKHGIFHAATLPRCKATVAGTRDDGTALPGEYEDGRALAEGYEENVEFFEMEYLDPHETAYGDKFESILPLLWLMAGAKGGRASARGYAPYFMPKASPFAVLIKEAHFPAFKAALAERPDITHVFLVTDSEEAFREMRAHFPDRETSMLYRDYLENFRINTEANL